MGNIMLISRGDWQLDLPYVQINIHDEQDIENRIQDVDLIVIHSTFDLSEKGSQVLNERSERDLVPIVIYGVSSGDLERFDTVNYVSFVMEENSRLLAPTIENLMKYRARYNEIAVDSELLELFLKYNTSYVFFKDENARVVRLSDNYSGMLGFPARKAIGKSMADIFPSELAEKMVKDDLKILNELKPVEVIEALNGKYYKTSKFPVVQENGKAILAGFTIDISDLKEIEKELIESKKQVEMLTVTDEMLNISNRRGFLSNLEKEIHRIGRYGGKSALIIFDIDKFKSFNDTLGHFKADYFLKDIAEKVKGLLREDDTFGRLGGDEFAVLCINTPLDKGIRVAERIQECLAAKPLILDGETYHYTVSIGVSEVNEGSGEMSQLLHKTDLALYTAKENGRNRIEVSR